MGRKGCDISYKKRRKKYKHALFSQIAIQLKFCWLINTFPTWYIVNHEITGIRKFVVRWEGRFAPGRRFAPCYSTHYPFENIKLVTFFCRSPHLLTCYTKTDTFTIDVQNKYDISIKISQPMFTLVLVLGVSVLDVHEYLIGENAKYLYLYLITSISSN